MTRVLTINGLRMGDHMAADLLGDAPELWSDGALCAQADPEAWFPEKGGSPREAKRICAACPVRSDCLYRAMDGGESFGIWGGLSPKERAAVRQRYGWGRMDARERDRLVEMLIAATPDGTNLKLNGVEVGDGDQGAAPDVNTAPDAVPDYDAELWAAAA